VRDGCSGNTPLILGVPNLTTELLMMLSIIVIMIVNMYSRRLRLLIVVYVIGTIYSGRHHCSTTHLRNHFSDAFTLIVTPLRSSQMMNNRMTKTSQSTPVVHFTTMNHDDDATIYNGKNDDSDDDNIFLSKRSSPIATIARTVTATTTLTTTPSFMDELVDRVRRNDTSPITFVGYITAKRSLSKNLIFLDLCTEGRLLGGDDSTISRNESMVPPDYSCQALLRKEHYTGLYYDGYVRCALQKGTKVQLIGQAASTQNPGNAILSIQSIDGLLGLPRQVQHIEGILREIALDSEGGGGGTLPIHLVAQACCLNENDLQDRLVEAERIAALQKQQQQNGDDERGSMRKKKMKSTIFKPFRDLAKQILTNLNDDPYYPSSIVDDRLVTKQRRGVENSYGLSPPPLQWKNVPSTVLEAIIRRRTTANSSSTATLELPNEEMTVLGIDNGSRSTVQSINEIYYDRNGEDFVTGNNSTRFVSVDGWIQNRRRFQNDVSVVVLVDDRKADTDVDHHDRESEGYGDPSTIDVGGDGSTILGSGSGSSTLRLECVLHPETLTESVAAVYRTLVAVGGKVSIGGYLIPDVDLKKVTIWVTSIRLLHSSDQPTAIYQLLNGVQSGVVGVEEAAEALLLSHTEMERLVAVRLSPTEQQWKANQLAEILQRASSHPTRTGLSPNLMGIVEKYSCILQQYPVRSFQGTSRMPSHPKTVASSGSSSAVGVSTMSGMPVASRWETKKRPQIDWMVDQIQRVLISHPDFGKRTLRILDIGGGKGLLANNLARSIHNVRIQVVDVCEGAIANGRKKAERTGRGVSNTSANNQSVISFRRADASSSSDLEGIDADVVVALHACGHLTDIALAHAIHRRAGFVIAPCCFNSNRYLTIPAQPSSSSSSGRPSSVHEWHNVPETDWRMLQSVAEIQGDIETASTGMKIICGIRAATVEQKWNNSGMTAKQQEGRNVEILAFPIEYSTRNLVLVGLAPSLSS
jgi:SAM-dependent methyltransferase